MADQVKLTFHGAAQTVTGSCMEIARGGTRILIDCGLFQGSRGLEHLNRGPFHFRPDAIDAVVLTHAHIDHSGLLPRLAAQGFRGPIFCTRPTRDLLDYMLADSARIQESDTARRNRRADRADEPPIAPLYTSEDAQRVMGQIETRPLDAWFDLGRDLQGRLWNAGHILGSASIELALGPMSLLFSGDIGPRGKGLEWPAASPSGNDHVVCEATYGDRERAEISNEQRLKLLGDEVIRAMERGGNLIIPAFAVERTQELLVDLATLFDRRLVPPRQVFIDSPLANRATEVFANYAPPLSQDGAVFRNSAFHYVERTPESMRLNDVSGAIILAGSGMCEGGRIRHHLVHNLPRRDSTVLFVGYQAQGSLGRTIVDGANRVRISGRDVAVRATVRRLESYSAHADQRDLIDWIGGRCPIKGSPFLSHGETGALQTLQRQLSSHAGAIIPAIGESYALLPGQPAKRLTTGLPEALRVIGADWQNDYAELAVNLKRDLQRIRDEDSRRDAIRRMRAVLSEYADHRARQGARGAGRAERRA